MANTGLTRVVERWRALRASPPSTPEAFLDILYEIPIELIDDFARAVGEEPAEVRKLLPELRLNPGQQRVYDAFATHQPCTVDRVCEVLRLKGSSVWPRHGELLAMGLLKEAGKGTTQSGKTAAMWEVRVLAMGRTPRPAPKQANKKKRGGRGKRARALAMFEALMDDDLFKELDAIVAASAKERRIKKLVSRVHEEQDALVKLASQERDEAYTAKRPDRFYYAVREQIAIEIERLKQLDKDIAEDVARFRAGQPTVMREHIRSALIDVLEKLEDKAFSCRDKLQRDFRRPDAIDVESRPRTRIAELPESQ